MEDLEKAVKELIDLNRLSASKVKNITELAMANVEHDAQLVSLLFRTHKKAPAANKLSSLYVVDAISREARSRVKKKLSKAAECEAFLAKMERTLEKIVEEALDRGLENHRDKVKKVLDIWTKSNTFSPALMSKLTAKAAAPPSAKATDSSTPVDTPEGGKKDKELPKAKEAGAAGAEGSALPANLLAILGATGPDKSAAQAPAGSSNPDVQAIVQQISKAAGKKEDVAAVVSANVPASMPIDPAQLQRLASSLAQQSQQQSSANGNAAPHPPPAASGSPALSGAADWGRREDPDRSSRFRDERRDDGGRGNYEDDRDRYGGPPGGGGGGGRARYGRSRSRSPPPRRGRYDDDRSPPPSRDRPPYDRDQRDYGRPPPPRERSPPPARAAPPVRQPSPPPAARRALSPPSQQSQQPSQPPKTIGNAMNPWHNFDPTETASWEYFGKWCSSTFGYIPTNEQLMAWIMGGGMGMMAMMGMPGGMGGMPGMGAMGMPGMGGMGGMGGMPGMGGMGGMGGGMSPLGGMGAMGGGMGGMMGGGGNYGGGGDGYGGGGGGRGRGGGGGGGGGRFSERDDNRPYKGSTRTAGWDTSEAITLGGGGGDDHGNGDVGGGGAASGNRAAGGRMVQDSEGKWTWKSGA